MENKNTGRRIHPLVAGAAISVMLVSLTGVAAITGLIPTSHGTPTPASPVAASVGAAAAASSPAALVEPGPDAKLATMQEKQPAAPTEAPAHKPAASKTSRHTDSRPQRSYASTTPARVATAEAVCHDCGHVVSVQAIQQAAQPSGVGMVAGAVLGGVLGNQVGGGNGRKLATVAGALGGGYAGNTIEKNTRSTTTYQVRVRMDGGEVRSFPYNEQPSWHSGDKVRVIDGQLTARG